MKVYVVGDHGPEHNSIRSIHRTYDGGLKEWDKLRLELLGEALSFLKNAKEKTGREMYQEIVKNLSCKDPNKIDNYPHGTPYIQEYEVKE